MMNDKNGLAYLDCFSGVSGDMLLGALLDCGLSQDLLQAELAKLPLGQWDLVVSRCTRQGIAATAVTVASGSTQVQQLRTLPDIIQLLESSKLESAIISRSLQVFRRLARAEATVHDRPIEHIHFHEIGALDTVVDIVGAIIGLHHLGITSIHCSPLPLGRGFVNCAHGQLPLPAPAVCELLSGLPIIGCEAERELVTPTGAALVAELTETFGTLPAMVIKRTGYGAGQAEGEARRPNLLRLIIGKAASDEETDQVEIIETHLDDWQSEGFPFLCDRLFDEQALDVSLTPMQMKKGRPGFCLRVISAPVHAQKIKELLLTETSTIGLRYHAEHRLTLPRRSVTVVTRWGPVTAKQVDTPVGTKTYPEYEACRTIAEQHRVPLDLVYREIIVKSAQEH